MTTQIAVRIPDALAIQLDELVANGRYESRAAAVRAGLEALMALERRRATDEAILDGYRRLPHSPTDRRSARASPREAIAEEAW